MSTQAQPEALSHELRFVPSECAGRHERLRVLHVVSRLALGGTEQGVLKLMEGLGEDLFEHRICAVRGIDQDFAERVCLTQKSCAVGSAKPGFQFPLFRLVRVMKEFRPHIVHSRNFGALEAVPAARLAGVPVVIHSEHGYEVETISGLPLRRRLLCRVFYAMTDSVFTVTKDLRSYHAAQSWLPESLFRVVYNGVNTLRFAPHPGVRDKVRSALGISQSSFVIGCVSRLVPIKDHGTLLRAAEKLIGQGKDVQVLLAGAGPEREKLEAYASASPSLQGKVIFVGSSDRVPELLNAMDVFVLASLCEGMSNTILEAMATGLPIVGSNAGGNAELTEDGKTGFLFTPHDVETLTRRLQQLIEDVELRQEFGFAARERALKIFDISRMIDTYRNLYFELAANREPRKKVQG